MPNVRSRQLAAAALKVAKANHYMVHLVVPSGTTWDEFCDAKKVLIDTEENGLEYVRSAETWTLAHDLLKSTCEEIHGKGSL